jgi:hypothetical protein
MDTEGVALGWHLIGPSGGILTKDQGPRTKHYLPTARAIDRDRCELALPSR